MLKAQVCNWSITVPTKDTTPEEKKAEKLGIMAFCKKNCNKWGFSLEKGEGGLIHWQIMFALWKKTLGTTVRDIWLAESKCQGHICPISTGNGRKFSYVCKPGAIDGPWTSETEEEEEIELPLDVSEIKELRLFQAQLAEWATAPGYEERKIRVLVDEIGGIGKSKLRRWLQFHCRKEVCVIPPVTDPKDVARMVLSLRKSTTKTYVIDIPRGWVNKKKLRDLYTALEALKDGGAWDDRYKGRQVMFTPPRILVLTNSKPELQWMSRDRWDFYEVVQNELKNMTKAYLSPAGGNEEIKEASVAPGGNNEIKN